jgi:hypothetical protein
LISRAVVAGQRWTKAEEKKVEDGWSLAIAGQRRRLLVEGLD